MSVYLKDDKTREKQQRGHNDRDWKPYIRANEFNSSGTCVIMADYKTRRTVHLHSQIESRVWYTYRFREDVKEIREQVPLDIDTTHKLADAFCIRHPGKPGHHMTTDFLLIYNNGAELAISVKSTVNSTKNNRTAEILFIEKKYWELRGVDFKIETNETINRIRADNIRICSPFYDVATVSDESQAVKHLIINHQIKPDLDSAIIDMRELKYNYRKEVVACLQEVQ